ncbi:MAG TPA: hypothetical protein VJ824_11180 [Bacillota bacterium]|nr:hypothetical protein [Bacillota bacterium]
MSQAKWSHSSQVLFGIAAAGLIGTIFLPWWGKLFIELQYSEGLDVVVYPYRMEDKIDFLNSLNHESILLGVVFAILVIVTWKERKA